MIFEVAEGGPSQIYTNEGWAVANHCSNLPSSPEGYFPSIYGVLACAPGYVNENGVCVQSLQCEAGQTLYGHADSPTACYNGCLVEHDLIAAMPDDGSGEVISVFGSWTTTGAQCPDGGDPVSSVPEDENGQHCTDFNGVEFCLGDGTGPNCGEINGEYVCLDNVPDEGCVTTPNGGTICGVNTLPEDLPQNEDGTPQVPDLELTPGPGNEPLPYFGGGGSGGTPPGGDDGGGDDGSDDPPDEPEQPCPEGETCDPNYTPVGPDDWYTPDDDKTFGTVLQAFSQRAGNAPFIAAANGFFDITITAGGCPVWVADVPLIGNLRMDVQCSSFMESLWPIVSAILLAIAGFTAFRWAFL